MERALITDCRRGLERYVLPVDRLTPLDASGFLDVSMADAWWAGPADRPRPIADLSGQAGSFVLLAADGAGKSTVFQGLRDREHSAIAVDLRVLDKAGMHHELQEAIEAVLHEPALFRVLERHSTARALLVGTDLVQRLRGHHAVNPRRKSTGCGVQVGPEAHIEARRRLSVAASLCGLARAMVHRAAAVVIAREFARLWRRAASLESDQNLLEAGLLAGLPTEAVQGYT